MTSTSMHATPHAKQRRFTARHLSRACLAAALIGSSTPAAADEWLTVRSSALYLTQAQQRERASHRDRIARRTGTCEERRKRAMVRLQEPSSRALRGLAQRCASAGLVMQRELRCHDGELQVRCGD